MKKSTLSGGIVLCVVVASQSVGSQASVARAQDAPPIAQHPAYRGNYQASSGRTIDTIVIHKAEGTAENTWDWFQNPKAKVSAHYVVDAGGSVAQMVPDQAIAWHTGNSEYNRRSIGVENAGFTDKNDISDAHLRGLAKITRYLCAKYHIPKDRKHVIGHNEVPDPNHPGRFGGRNNHTDPGRYFNWTLFMKYLNDDPGEAQPAAEQPDPASPATQSSSDAPSSASSQSDGPSSGATTTPAGGSSGSGSGHPRGARDPQGMVAPKDDPDKTDAAKPDEPKGWLEELLSDLLALIEKFLTGGAGDGKALASDGDGLPLPVRPAVVASRSPSLATPKPAPSDAMGQGSPGGPPREGLAAVLQGFRD